jgi:hypothetical protein
MMLWHSLSSMGGIQTSPATWDPTVNSVIYTFSSSNLVVTRTSDEAQNRVARATAGVFSGKYYWETLRIVGTDGFDRVGLIKPGDDVSTYLGATTGGYSWDNASARTLNNGTAIDAPVITLARRTCYALDMDNGAVWFGELDTSNNVLWMSGTSLLAPGGTVNPATNTGARYTGLSGSYVPAVSTFFTTHAFRAYFSQSEWIGIGRPSGFGQLP